MLEDAKWYKDEESFAFKIVYTLKLPTLKLVLLYDKKVDHVASGTVIIDTQEYMEFNLEDFTVKQAKRILVTKAINIGSSVLMKKCSCEKDDCQRSLLIDNLADLYTMLEETVKKEKEEFRSRYKKGEKL